MRERLIVNINISFCNRITPACAGRTLPLPAYIHPNEDHPRSRGKDYTLSFSYSVRSGSPPLAREGLIPSHLMMKSVRITPARAGRTSLMLFHVFQSRDHPRSRGKDPVTLPVKLPLTGSPPLAREGHIKSNLPKINIRITPARAGRTVLILIFGSFSGDHPRSRGKDIFLL